MRLLLVLVVAAALVLGYGYYHAATHGALYISLVDSSVKPYSGNIRNAVVRLFDSDGKFLAEGKSDHRYGVIRLIHPEVGDCAAAEENATSSSTARDAWQQCFETISQWVVGWVDRIRSADVKFETCDIKALPVAIRKSRDWWLWWVPLPHVGGKPYTYFNLSINVDGTDCLASLREFVIV